MKEVIKKIKCGEDVEYIFQCVLQHIYSHGPIEISDLEILCYLKYYHPDAFSEKEAQILQYMGLNFKSITSKSLTEVIFSMYAGYIEDKYGSTYTPVQANIAQMINDNKCFSFSAPTSTGKSFVFRNIIANSVNDIVIVVPSRALINEYYKSLCTMIADKSINILTFIDRINIKHAKRNVFIVTPERCKDLFKHKEDFIIDFFLFDEAQLSNEETSRGMYFDSIVRRAQKSFESSKFIFAHPFVANPQAQISKHHFDRQTSSFRSYVQKNVGQMFYAMDDAFRFYHFGIDKEVMGKNKIECENDPIKEAIDNGGSVLVYTSKASIYSKKIFEKYERYIDLCSDISSDESAELIERIRSYIGADIGEECHSDMLRLMKRGIVIHHGSLPLQARLIMEEFTQRGFCKICFATSTLEQGVNMPFDVVVLNSFKASKPLALKNLIGRAGRSTTKDTFDFGCVVIKTSNISKFRNLMKKEEILEEQSLLEKNVDDDLIDFQEAINNGTLSDEYNISETQIEKIQRKTIEDCLLEILDLAFDSSELQIKRLASDEECRNRLVELFECIYADYLGRPLEPGEVCVLHTSVKILLWQIQCKTFKDICFYRYAYASRMQERKQLALLKNGKNDDIIDKMINDLKVPFIMECNDIPNRKLNVYSMFSNVKATKVDYDRIVFDTYDYLDKIIGFRLGDIFYAAFDLYYIKTADSRAKKMANLVKYGTDNDKEIWMKRYGFSFEDIEWLDSCIDEINQNEIVFNKKIESLTFMQREQISRYIWD